MSRITMQDPKEATGQLATLFRTVQTKLGLVPNMMKALGSSPAVLEAYLGLSETLGRTSLSAALRERIALHVGEINACGYCLSAHSAIAARMGLDPDAIGDARRGKADDGKTAAALALARAIVVERGRVRDGDLREARNAGLSDTEIVEVFGATLLNVFTNWFNHITDTPIDFPLVEPGIEVAQGN
ncbi:MAG: carboxymuconolactone decarboxylase family protein [Planctomycetes bacterium]|nr:carboxymuconolactone decarboxylase family protein [Planctomycetota bacterium]